MSQIRTVIVGAAGRDCHDFNTVFRGDDRFDVVAFTHTATQNIGELDEYGHLDTVLPAMGYSDTQIRELETTIRNADPDVVVSGTPHDLARVIDVEIPIERVRYALEETNLALGTVLDRHAELLGI